MKFIPLLVFISLALLMTPHPSRAGTIKFSGYEWEIRPTSEDGGPGPNHWDEHNVQLDSNGFLHLKLTHHDGKWYCAELNTVRKFKFGTYQFWIAGPIDTFDQNVVLGLFNYPESDVGPDGTHEMDIEFSRWRNPHANMGNYTVYPTMVHTKEGATTFPFTLRKDTLSTHRLIWSSTSILFQSLHGLRDDNADIFQSWLYKPVDPAKHISQSPMPVHINLWCCDGKPPKDGKEVEIVIRSFKFTENQ